MAESSLEGFLIDISSYTYYIQHKGTYEHTHARTQKHHFLPESIIVWHFHGSGGDTGAVCCTQWGWAMYTEFGTRQRPRENIAMDGGTVREGGGGLFQMIRK